MSKFEINFSTVNDTQYSIKLLGLIYKVVSLVMRAERGIGSKDGFALSQKQYARRLGIANGAVSFFEMLTRNPSPEQIINILADSSAPLKLTIDTTDLMKYLENSHRDVEDVRQLKPFIANLEELKVMIESLELEGFNY